MADSRTELLGGLTFDVDAEPVPPSRTRRGLRGVALLVVVAVLAAGAVVARRWWSDRDLRDTVASTRDAYRRAAQQVLLASDATTLAGVAGRVQPVAAELDAAASRLRGTDGGRRDAVRAQARAEAAVLRALAPLADLPSSPLSVYGRTAGALTAAAEQEGRTRADLADADPGAARGLPDTAAVVRRVGSAAGAALLEDVQRSGGELLDALAQAQRTADLRGAADRAAGQRDAVAAARSGLGSAPGAGALDELVAALDAVRDLRELTPAATDRWPAVRQRLAEHLGAVGQAADSLAAGSLRSRLPLVLDGVDALVERAAQQQAQWQSARDAAVAQQAADSAAVNRYADDVTAALRDGAAARTGLAQVLGQALTADAAGTALAPLAASTSAAADRVRTATVPAGAEAAHAALLARLDALAEPLAAAVLELGTTTCPDCAAADLPSWAGLAAAAGASWDAEAAAWQRAVDAARAAVAARALPAPPDV